MILGLATVFVTYASVRVYEHYNKSNKTTSKKKLPAKKVTKLSAKKNELKVRLQNLLAENNENSKNKHYVIMSGVSISLASARFFYAPLTLATIVVFSYIAIPYLRQTEKSLLVNKKIDGYVLYGFADMMMLAMGAYASAAIGIGLLHLSKYVLSNAKEKSKRQLIDIFNKQPDKVWVLKNGIEVQLTIDQLDEGDILVVNAGDIIPVDGIITEGISAVDQKVLTGESHPSDKSVGDQVYASTMVISGQISIRMEQSGQDTIVAKIGDIINNSIEFKGTQELKGERWADSYTFSMFVLAMISWPFLGAAATVGILYCHIANTIRVIAPLGTLNYLNIAAKNGILVKDGHAFEELGNIDAVIFDKTGTLTQEIPEVGQIILCGSEYTEEDILFYAAAAEQKSVHPIAKAIINKAQDFSMELPKIDDSSYDIGYGISVNIDDKLIQLGSVRFMDMKNINIPKKIQNKIDTALALGHSVITVAIDKKLRGILEIHTIVRPEAAKTIDTLRKCGIKCMAIVSGDQELPTQSLATSLGMDQYYYEILPEGKAEIVEELQKSGRKVAFIGDGVNDTLAMEKADISISLSGASSIATDVAQVVLMDGSLTHIPALFKLSRKLDKNLSRSLILNIIPNAVALNGVLFFRFGMLTTILVSQSSLIFGAINAFSHIEEKPTHSIEDSLREA